MHCWCWLDHAARVGGKEIAMKARFVLSLAAVGLVLGGCDYGTKSTRSLRLPQGSVENGKIAFVALKCVECHSVAGVDLPKPTAAPEKVVVLGGEVARLRSIGDLLTSIIHPDYAISEKMRSPGTKLPTKSPMPAVNDVMTVRQMIDLVTFLQPHYKQLPAPLEYNYPL
jgi:hypothetical protein